MNVGYVGFARSVRSASAIESHEMPLRMINKTSINSFLKENNYQNPNVPVSIWKFVAKDVGPTSWHHTSSYYNRTDHYSLYIIHEKLQENKDYYVERYKNRVKKEVVKPMIEYACMEVQVWGGTRNYPKLLRVEKLYGVVKDLWFYHVTYKLEKLSTISKKVIEFKTYNSLGAMIADNAMKVEEMSKAEEAERHVSRK